jgi:hypothetical protein
MRLFDPDDGVLPALEPDARKVAIAELQALANTFHRSAVASGSLSIRVTYTSCAEYVEGRIRALQRGDQFHV